MDKGKYRKQDIQRKWNDSEYNTQEKNMCHTRM